MTSPITDQILSDVLRQYPLVDPRIVAPFEASKRNENVLVEDTAGARYALRRYRRNPDERRIEFQLRFQQELLRRGFPTSEVIEPRSGGRFVTSEAGPWVLFSFVEGDEYDFSRPAQAAEAGRRLAEFHTVTEAIDLEEVVVAQNPPARRWWTTGEEEIAALEALFTGKEIEAEVAFLRTWREHLLREWPVERLDALPTGWVHDDYHGRNMVFLGDELRGLFDFDALHRGFWVEDLGHALFMFGREFRGSTHIRPEVARLFLEAYGSQRQLSAEELAALPVMSAVVWSPSAPYHALLERDGEDTLAFFRHYVVLMRELQSEMERLWPVLVE
jgi:Ser/Thr protein kinase RdoA (MazF antagonist)